jgi:hypothetical protein
MSLSSILNVAIICILLSSFTSVAKAQLASDKSLAEIYNKKINEKLAEKNKSGNAVKPSQKEQDLPSNRSSLKTMAKSKIRNAEIAPHPNNLAQSDEEKKSKLPSNSNKLKQIGAITIKSRTSTTH